jgi:hypothetical protein
MRGMKNFCAHWSANTNATVARIASAMPRAFTGMWMTAGSTGTVASSVVGTSVGRVGSTCGALDSGAVF